MQRRHHRLSPLAPSVTSAKARCCHSDVASRAVLTDVTSRAVLIDVTSRVVLTGVTSRVVLTESDAFGVYP